MTLATSQLIAYRRTDNLNHQLAEVFDKARTDFRLRFGLRDLHYAEHPSVHHFGQPRAWTPLQVPSALPHLDHWIPLATGGRLAAVMSWPYRAPETVRAYLGSLDAERFAWAVVEPQHPAAQLYPTADCAWLLADRLTTCADLMLDAYLDGHWAAKHARKATELARELSLPLAIDRAEAHS